MQFTEALQKLSRTDSKLIRRDSFTVTLAVYGLVIVALIRLGLPPITDALLNNQNFDLVPYYPLIISFMVIHQLGPIMGGTIAGFLMLDERDNQTIKALMVTPLPPRIYVFYRVLAPFVLSLVLTMVGLFTVNPLGLAWWEIVLLSGVGSLFSPIVALYLTTMAGNKVEGFAQVKIVGSLGLIVFGAWFLPEPWQFLAGFYPPFWANKAYWVAGTSLFWACLGLGLIAHLIVLALFVRRFSRVIYA